LASKQIFRNAPTLLIPEVSYLTPEAINFTGPSEKNWFPRELCNCCESKSLIGIFSLSDNRKICFLCLDIIRKELKLEEVYGIDISRAKKILAAFNKPKPVEKIK